MRDKRLGCITHSRAVDDVVRIAFAVHPHTLAPHLSRQDSLSAAEEFSLIGKKPLTECDCSAAEVRLATQTRRQMHVDELGYALGSHLLVPAGKLGGGSSNPTPRGVPGLESNYPMFP